MATLTIRNVPDHLRDALRVRAAKNGRSMEAELRAMIKAFIERKSDSEAPDTHPAPRHGVLSDRGQPLSVEKTLELIDHDREGEF